VLQAVVTQVGEVPVGEVVERHDEYKRDRHRRCRCCHEPAGSRMRVHESQRHTTSSRACHSRIRVPELQVAAIEQEVEDRAQVAQAIGAVVSGVEDLTADVLAGCCMAAPDSALDRWQKAYGTEDLGHLIDRAFDALVADSGPPST